jgi:hypothetical protein
MNIPSEIWDIIVKQSKKTNEELVVDMCLKELKMLETVITERKTTLYNEIKSKIDKYDIIEVFDNDNKYVTDYVVINKIAKRECCIRVCELKKCNKKTIFGNYLNGNMSNEDLCLTKYNFKIISKIQDRSRENINIANKLKIGDVFNYSLYNVAEWCEMRNKIYEMETFVDGISYHVVSGITRDKIIIKNYYKINDGFIKIKRYLNKNTILNKVEYTDNATQYIKCKKKLLFESIVEISKITSYKNYFENVNKKQLIKLQKQLKI